MMFTAPQITQLRNQVWKEITICYNLMMMGDFKWLAEHIEIKAESVYKNYAKTWYILAKTAPKGAPET